MAFIGYYYFIIVALLFSLCAVSLSDVTDGPLTGAASAVLVRVDQSGKGDYTKIQDAIDSVPSNNSELVFILVKPGIYKEKVAVPADKPFITLSGTKASETVITWSDGGGIFDSPTLSVLASDFVARYLTIQNTYEGGGQAVALRVSADRAAFYGCRLLGIQDTLLDDTGRHYYRSCYIEGSTDFICGNAASLFEVEPDSKNIPFSNPYLNMPNTFMRCHIHSLAEGTGSITAQRRESPSENTGFAFLGCTITGVRTAMLGRPWGDYSRVVFALSYMSNAILPQGWDDWGDFSKQSTVFYGQYKCYGPGAVTSKRVKWAKTLTSVEAEPFMTKDLIDGKAWIRPVPTSFRRAFNASTVGENN